MKIFKRPNGSRPGCASLDNIGFCLLEVNLEGEVYTYSIQGISEHCEVERVGNIHSDLACEYITSKGLSGYWQGFSPPK